MIRFDEVTQTYIDPESEARMKALERRMKALEAAVKRLAARKKTVAALKPKGVK